MTGAGVQILRLKVYDNNKEEKEEKKSAEEVLATA